MNILCVFICLSLVPAIRGDSPSSEGYDRRNYGAESSGIRTGESPGPRDQTPTFFGPGVDEDVDSGADRPSPRRGAVDPEVADQLEGNGWLDVIPGTPGKDYPNYERIPETSFTCDGKTAGGYYADIEARCQVFHVCNTGGQKSSFVCPSGSIFNQKYFVCDWWYDFECDDATDLYSLNEKVNRGGTGSGPGGPGRVEQTGEYSSESSPHFPREEPRDDGNFVSADGFDLSLAGTGEGGPGYARNGNNKGYQSNVDDDEDPGEKRNGENYGRGRRRENFNAGKTNGGSYEPDYPSNVEKSQNPRGESPPDFSHGLKEDREYFRGKNTGAENPGVNQRGNLNGNGDDNDRDYRSNGFVENRNNPGKYTAANGFGAGNDNDGDYPRGETRIYDNDYKNDGPNERGNEFGRRSSTGSARKGYIAAENSRRDYRRGSSSPGSSSGFGDYEDFSNSKDEGLTPNGREFNSDKSPAPYSGLDNNEYRNPSAGTGAAGPGNVRGRQRASGGLPGGLGNGYPSPGRARELPGSDAIASSITPGEGTVYGEGNQRPANSHQETSSARKPAELTDPHPVVNDGQKIGFHRRSQHTQRSDFHDGRSPKNRKYTGQGSHSGSENTFESNHRRETNGQVADQRRQGPGKNYGDDYLVGIVPGGTEDRGNGSSDSNQPRRYLPIL